MRTRKNSVFGHFSRSGTEMQRCNIFSGSNNGILNFFFRFSAYFFLCVFYFQWNFTKNCEIRHHLIKRNFSGKKGIKTFFQFRNIWGTYLVHIPKQVALEMSIYLKVQSWPKYMRQTLLLVWNSALREKCNFNFWTVFC